MVGRLFLNYLFRNTGFIEENWNAIRECKDKRRRFRPIPELARYRNPINKLYLCHQMSYPGVLCLLAIPYNLMHIPINDGTIKKLNGLYLFLITSQMGKEGF